MSSWKHFGWLGAMVDPVVLDGSAAAAAGETIRKKPGRKRKRSLLWEKMSSEEKEALASDCRREVDSLFVYMKEFVGGRVGLEEVGAGGALRLSDSVVACLVEESGLPFKKLVQEVYQRLEEEDGVTVASVGSAVLRVGERRMYGVEKKDADVLEDESESCIWCWEVRVWR